MPTIPVYEYNVQPPSSTNPLLQNPESVGQVGAAIQKSSAVIENRLEQYQREQDALTASETMSKLNDREREYMKGELNSLGRNAVGATTRGNEFYAQQMKELSNGLSGGAHQLFTLQATQAREAGMNRLATHEAQQHQKRKEDNLATTAEGIRQQIRNGASQESVEAQVSNLMSFIDTEYSGLDMTEVKAKFRDDIYSEFLNTMAVKNPDGIVQATDRWKGTMETGVLNKFLQKVDMANAIRDLHRDPENFMAKDYASLDPVQQASLQEQATRLYETRLTKRIHDWDKSVKAQEKAIKDAQQQNEVLFLIGMDKGTLSIEDVQQAGIRRQLDPAAVKYFMEKYQDGVNDPEAVATLSSMVEQKIDVRPELTRLLHEHRIKRQTYIDLVKQVGNEQYWKGMTMIRGALEPGPEDKFNADRNLKWADGFEEWNKLIRGGLDPVEAANTIIDGYYSKIRRTVSTLPKPKYWTGTENIRDQQAVSATIDATVAAYQNGMINDATLVYELNNIKKLTQAIYDEQRVNANSGSQIPADTRNPKNRPVK